MDTSRTHLADGAALGLLIWSAEALAVAVGTLGTAGIPVLAGLRDELALWGLAYVLVGAGFGLLGRTRFGRFGSVGRFAPPLGWLALWMVADPGVVPGALHLGVLALAFVAWAVWLRLPEGRTATGPVGTALLAGAWLLPTSSGMVRGVRSDRPDVLLVVIDTLRADHVGAYGYGRPTTPTIDALAREGLRFASARSTASWTLPAHASLFTGMLPSEHGAHAGHPVLDGDPSTLAERFASEGYRTVGLSANAWVSAGTGLDRGFQRFGFLGDDGIVSQLLLPLVVSRPRDLGGRAITDAALAELRDAREAGEPLFLFVNLLESHEPLGSVPEPDRSAFGPVDPVLGRTWMRDMPRFWCACSPDAPAADPDGLSCGDGLFRASPDRVRRTIDAYDAGVAYADARLGELIAEIDRSGRAGRTLVVVTSDHGEHLEPDGRLGHMVWADDALLDVPLVVRGPGVPVGAVDVGPLDLSELGGWVLARASGAVPPIRRLRATSEVHPHPASTIRAWSAIYGCDFEPAATARRVVRTVEGTTRQDGGGLTWEEPDERALDPSTRRSLEALGYVE